VVYYVSPGISYSAMIDIVGVLEDGALSVKGLFTLVVPRRNFWRRR